VSLHAYAGFAFPRLAIRSAGDLLHRQECALFHTKTATVLAIEAPQQHGELARRRELKKADVQALARVDNGARSGRLSSPTRIRSEGVRAGSRLRVSHARPVPSSSRHYPEKCSTVWARPARVAP